MPDDRALALDSPRWRELRTRQGPGAAWVADILRGLRDGALAPGAFDEMWPHLCSEGSTYDAAYAAAPHLTQLAAEHPPTASRTYLIVLGLIATDAGEIPDDLAPAYRRSSEVALRLTLDALVGCPVTHELRHLLAAVAALRGATGLAETLQNLDTVQEPCPSCGEHVFPSELQRLVDDERRA